MECSTALYHQRKQRTKTKIWFLKKIVFSERQTHETSFCNLKMQNSRMSKNLFTIVLSTFHMVFQDSVLKAFNEWTRKMKRNLSFINLQKSKMHLFRTHVNSKLGSFFFFNDKLWLIKQDKLRFSLPSICNFRTPLKLKVCQNRMPVCLLALYFN